jgi:hypothetical protein
MLRRSVVAGVAFAILAARHPASADIIRPGPPPPPKKDPPGPRQLNLGPLASMLVPASWTRSEKTIAGRWALVEFSPPGKSDGLIGVMFGPQRGDAKSNAALHQLMADNAKIAAPLSLTPEQIRAVSPTLGNIGDNQYANDAKIPDSRAPAFNLSNAQVIAVNRKAVIRIEGSFRDNSGKPVNWFAGLVAVSKEDDGNVLQAYAEAPDEGEFKSRQVDFNAAVRSIVWRN